MQRECDDEETAIFIYRGPADVFFFPASSLSPPPPESSRVSEALGLGIASLVPDVRVMGAGRLKRGGGPFGRKKAPALITCAPPPPPSPDSVLERLDQFDLRLKQLEENMAVRQPHLPQSPPLPAQAAPAPPPLPPIYEEHISEELKQAAKAPFLGYPDHKQELQREEIRTPSPPLAAARPEPDVRASLMDRLRLLESRILRLSLDLLERDGSSCMASSSAARRQVSSSDSMWTTGQSADSTSSGEEQTAALIPAAQVFSVGVASKRAAGPGKGFRGCFSRMKKKATGCRQDGGKAGKKAAAGVSKEEKKRMERTRMYRRWFPVAAIGC